MKCPERQCHFNKKGSCLKVQKKIRLRRIRKLVCRFKGHQWGKDKLFIKLPISRTLTRYFYDTRICERCAFGESKYIIDVVPDPEVLAEKY